MAAIKNLILFDGPFRENLLPLTYTRPTALLRVGITTIIEKWQSLSGAACSTQTLEYLSEKFPMHLEDTNTFVNGSLIPDEKLVHAIEALKDGEALVSGNILLAYTATTNLGDHNPVLANHTLLEYEHALLCIQNPWDIFTLNDAVLRDDFRRITAGRKSQPLSATNTFLGADQVFMEEGARCECAIINATTGPVYIGKDAEIMEGVVVRGPLALCEHAALKMGAKIYGATTLGPHCKVGGEVHNSVLTGYSSKAHDGYLGNAVLGEWCNLGADTNNSNLKNNYEKVKVWSYKTGRFVPTGLQFCGLIMGDHSKSGINTMFNTGTVVGVSANIFGSGFPRNFVPSFSWGGSSGFIEFV